MQKENEPVGADSGPGEDLAVTCRLRVGTEYNKCTEFKRGLNSKKL